MTGIQTARLSMVLLVVIAGGATACGDDDDDAEAQVEADAGKEPTKHAETAHWGYSGDVGPAHWADLDEANALCGEGVEQTPIDFPATSTPGLVHAMETHYEASTLTILNNGHTVQVNYDPGSTLTLDGVEYELVQFHFHAHSEHTVAGQSHPLELHLVHKSSAGKLAVVGVFIDEGDENAALAAVFDNLPAHESEADPVEDAEVDAADILPEHLWAWRYQGSLTTPPCSEEVEWTVLAEPITASAAQIEAFTDLFANNFRPVQELGARTIEGAHFDYEDSESGPMHWGELAPTWAACEEGEKQSPIDIPASATPAVFADLKVSYEPSALEIVNNGHTVQVNYEPGSEITIAGETYTLVQFHFHAHSEHTVAGKSAPMELHLVHRSEAGALAVIGLMIEEGDESSALDSVLSNMPATAGPAKKIAGKMVDASKLLPDDLAMWRYDGSLTTPPCSEGVQWHVVATPIEASAAQIAKFTSLYDADARPVQPLGKRTIH